MIQKSKKIWISLSIVLSLEFCFILAIFVSVLNHPSYAANSTDKIHFIKNSYYGGDSILVESNGHYMLIDALHANYDTSKWDEDGDGNYNNETETDDGVKISAYLKGVLGNSKLDYVLMTHAHGDHVGGIPYITNYIGSNTIVIYKYVNYVYDNDNQEFVCRDTLSCASDSSLYSFDQALNALNNLSSKPVMCELAGSTSLNPTSRFSSTCKSKLTFHQGTFSEYTTNVDDSLSFELGNVNISLYNLYHITSYSSSGQTQDTRENQNSIITLVTTKGGKKAALLADIETVYEPSTGYTASDKGVEEQVADIIGDVDILKAGHHGNDSSNAYYSLNRFNPEYMVVTSSMPFYEKGTVSESSYGKVQESFGFATAFLKLKGKNSYSTNQSHGAVVAEITSSSIAIKDYNLNGTTTSNNASSINNIVKDGWYVINNNVRADYLKTYVENGNISIGWKKINDNWYYFNSNGVMLTGWQYLTYNGLNNWYYFYPTFTWDTDCLTEFYNYIPASESSCTYPTTSYPRAINDTNWGKMINGWLQDENYDNQWFYLGYYGDMLTGWQKIGGKWYYFCTNEDKASGLCSTRGAMFYGGTYTIHGISGYTFNDSGVLTNDTEVTTLAISPQAFDYTGNPVEMSASSNKSGTIQYHYYSDNSCTTTLYSAPVNVGSYSAKASLGNLETQCVQLVINKVDNPTNIVASSTTYSSGSALVTVQNAVGTPYYAVGTALNTNNYASAGSQTIPTSKNLNAGTYKVYYYIPTTATYNEKSGYVSVTISPTSNPTVIQKSDQTYGSTNSLVTVSKKNGTVYYSLEVALNATNYSTKGTTSLPSASGKNAGSYTIYYYIPANINYNEKSGFVVATISKSSNPTKITVVSLSISYGSSGSLVSTSNVQGTPYYSVDTFLMESNYATAGSTTIPTAVGKQAGKHKVYYYIPATTNYMFKSGSLAFTISPITPVLSLTSSSSEIMVGQAASITAKTSVVGKYNVTSSDTKVATVQSSTSELDAQINHTITVNGISSGKATITVEFIPTDSTNYARVTKTYVITVKDTTPDSNPPENNPPENNPPENNTSNSPPPENTQPNNESSNSNSNNNNNSNNNSNNSTSNNGNTSSQTNSSSMVVDKEKGTITQIQIGTKYEDIKRKLELPTTLDLKANDQSTSSNFQTNAKSCDKISFTLDNQEISYILSVKGDVTGDGTVSIADLVKIYYYVKEKTTFEDCYKSAADISGNDEVIDSSDVSTIYRYLKDISNSL